MDDLDYSRQPILTVYPGFRSINSNHVSAQFEDQRIKWTTGLIREMCELYSAGLKNEAIADKLGTTTATVQSKITRLVKSGRLQRREKPRMKEKPAITGAHSGRQKIIWSEKDLARLLNLFKAGYKYYEMAENLGLPERRIEKKLSELFAAGELQRRFRK